MLAMETSAKCIHEWTARWSKGGNELSLMNGFVLVAAAKQVHLRLTTAYLSQISRAIIPRKNREAGESEGRWLGGDGLAQHEKPVVHNSVLMPFIII